jgi:uncharacterized protein (DUF302 family)
MEFLVRRFSVISRSSFEEVESRLAQCIGQPDMTTFKIAIANATFAELQDRVRESVGSSDLMEFARFNAGEVLRKENGGNGPRIFRLLVGNPLIMKEMAKSVPDAASYAPVTILIDERPDGVHLSYDSMASQLAPYGSATALGIARDLDCKVESLLVSVAR